jgi:hypothetical protein
MMPFLRNLNTNQAMKEMRSAKSKYVVSTSSEILHERCYSFCLLNLSLVRGAVRLRMEQKSAKMWIMGA